jgi:hypothetical protein
MIRVTVVTPLIQTLLLTTPQTQSLPTPQTQSPPSPPMKDTPCLQLQTKTQTLCPHSLLDWKLAIKAGPYRTQGASGSW